MYEKFGQFIDGEVAGDLQVKKLMKFLNPANEEVIGRASKANSQDVQRALLSAKKGLELWKNTSPWERAKVLTKIYLN